MVVGLLPSRTELGPQQRADQLFHALADATRRDIVVHAMHGAHSVSDLARRYPMSLTAVQKHVAVLERAGLVTKERRGREQIVHTRIETIRLASRLLDDLETVWRGRLDRFGDVLTGTHPEPLPESHPESHSESHPPRGGST